jgi:hypothetical protein
MHQSGCAAAAARRPLPLPHQGAGRTCNAMMSRAPLADPLLPPPSQPPTPQRARQAARRAAPHLLPGRCAGRGAHQGGGQACVRAGGRALHPRAGAARRARQPGGHLYRPAMRSARAAGGELDPALERQPSRCAARGTPPVRPVPASAAEAGLQRAAAGLLPGCSGGGRQLPCRLYFLDRRQGAGAGLERELQRPGRHSWPDSHSESAPASPGDAPPAALCCCRASPAAAAAAPAAAGPAAPAR